jgi:H+-translocating NAD(P) transhydrogenase subunit beta
MEPVFYYIICAVLSIAVLSGIALMSKVKTAVLGNRISSLAMALAMLLTLVYFEILSQGAVLAMALAGIAIGSVIGAVLADKVKMIQMPELVALFNGVGGAASALVGIGAVLTTSSVFALTTGVIALIIGTLTLTGSLIAAGKLSSMIDGKPVIWKGHQALTNLPIILLLVLITATAAMDVPLGILIVTGILVSGFLGIAFSIRVGGADMPITISLLNSFSGVAGSIAGMAIGDVLLVSVGGIVGASGLLLTRIMCKSMNSSLLDILLGKTTTAPNTKPQGKTKKAAAAKDPLPKELSAGQVLGNAKKVIIVPGYGMAIAQAQHLVKQLADTLEAKGAEVKYAIHPVAGRMPGHMNVLLSEADVDYEQLFEMDEINGEFSTCDACVVVGANDVLNPAARDAEGTPIYGMPILNADRAKHIIFCNYNLDAGYAGVDNPLYQKEHGISLLTGDAADTLKELLQNLAGRTTPPEEKLNIL